MTSPTGTPTPAAPPIAPAHLVDLRWAVAYPLYRVCTGIGRDASNPVIVRDPAASRTHCEVQREGDRFTLHPVGLAETRVNGVQLAGPHELAEGDLIEIAYSRLRFTRRPLARDVTLAPEHTAVDSDFAGRRTEVREIVSPERLQQLRRQMLKPVELHWRLLVMAIGLGALALAALIRLAMRALGL